MSGVRYVVKSVFFGWLTSLAPLHHALASHFAPLRARMLTTSASQRMCAVSIHTRSHPAHPTNQPTNRQSSFALPPLCSAICNKHSGHSFGCRSVHTEYKFLVACDLVHRHRLSSAVPFKFVVPLVWRCESQDCMHAGSWTRHVSQNDVPFCCTLVVVSRGCLGCFGPSPEQ
jgi:hypothetical protein